MSHNGKMVDYIRNHIKIEYMEIPFGSNGNKLEDYYKKISTLLTEYFASLSSLLLENQYSEFFNLWICFLRKFDNLVDKDVGYFPLRKTPSYYTLKEIVSNNPFAELVCQIPREMNQNEYFNRVSASIIEQTQRPNYFTILPVGIIKR